jgi:hypothetical protein
MFVSFAGPFAFFACIDVKKEQQASGFSFDGAARLEPIDGGRWRLVWNPITAITNARFLVYEKDDNNTPWKFENPVGRTKEHSITT